MNRRQFLHRATLAAAALALDPERLLWVPGQRTIFLPSLQPVTTCRLLTLAELVAVTYGRVMTEHAKAEPWANSILLQCLRRDDRNDVVRFLQSKALIVPVDSSSG